MHSFKQNGGAYIKDPRIDFSYNDKLIDLMESYYAKRMKQISLGMDGKEIDIIDHRHQQGLTKPEYYRTASHIELKQMLKEEHKCFSPLERIYDKILTYTWLVDNPNNPLPKDFP